MTTANIILDEKINEWILKDFTIESELAPELSGLNSFDFAFGINDDKTDFYLDNISFLSTMSGLDKNSTSTISYNTNTLFLSDIGNVNVYDLNGRLQISKVNVTSVDMASFAHGVYIAKAMIEGKTQIVKFVK